MTGATLQSVNVGMPKDVPWQGRTVHTGIWKSPVTGPAMVRRLNIDGDGQGDTNGHGGEQRAVMVYQVGSYRHWARHFGRDDLPYGVFGENFTVDGLADDQVCIGDRYRIGEAEFEVTQPRVTCYRVGLRLGQPELPALLVSHHRPGFYLRVLHEGRVRAGDQIVKTQDGPGALSVASADALLYLPGHDQALLRRALDIPALSPGWQGSFREMLAAAESGPAAGAAAPAGPAWAGFRPLRVSRIVPDTATVSSIYLNDPAGSALPPARAGQYLTFRITGAGDPAPVRSYSLSSAPGAADYRISVKHEPHGLASGYLDTDLRVGDNLAVAAPRGDFVLDDGQEPVLLISAGIGVTPVLAMLHQLASEPGQREVWWMHAARSPAEHALAHEARDLLAALPRASRIHTELFGALAAINPGLTGQARRPPHVPDGPPGPGPVVTFARSGLAVPYDPARGSVLDLADACDVPTRWSCRTGVCHTCVTPLLSGQIGYTPDPLEPPAGGEVLICCARPRTDVVLDM